MIAAAATATITKGISFPTGKQRKGGGYRSVEAELREGERNRDDVDFANAIVSVSRISILVSNFVSLALTFSFYLSLPGH